MSELKDVAWKGVSAVSLPLVLALGGWVWNVNSQLIEMQAATESQNEKVAIMYKVIVLDKLEGPE